MDVEAFGRFAALVKCPVSLWALLWNSEGERGRTYIHYGLITLPILRKAPQFSAVSGEYWQSMR